MPKKPIFQDFVVVVKKDKRIKNQNIIFEPNSSLGWQNMISLLAETINQLMDFSATAYQKKCHKLGGRGLDLDFMTRLSTNECFFYTDEPLSLKDFETLQNIIAAKAKMLSGGIQLILSSFAVKTNDDRVMNVTVHITCGRLPVFHLIVKNNKAYSDVVYHMRDEAGRIQTLPCLDKKSASHLLPKIIINGVSVRFGFFNVLCCTTPGGTSFLTAVDVCLDHKKGVAKSNYKALTQNMLLSKLPVDHVVVSNSIDLSQTQSIHLDVLHVDPVCSPNRCKKGFLQRANSLKSLCLPFGNDFYNIYEVEEGVNGCARYSIP